MPPDAVAERFRVLANPRLQFAAADQPELLADCRPTAPPWRGVGTRAACALVSVYLVASSAHGFRPRPAAH